jgi:CHAD domain-containing protein/CYTH domain-containing protein
VKIPDDILARTPEEAGRRVALGLLTEARRAVRRLDDPTDLDALHDFRVAVRRLRSTLRAYRGPLNASVKKKDRRALRELQAKTSEGRDAEVALEWLAPQRSSLRAPQRIGFDWLTGQLEERKARAYETGRREVRREFDALYRSLKARLAVMEVEVDLVHPKPKPTWAAFLADATRTHANEVAGLLGRITSPTEIELAHATRIASKRLRYLLEPARRALPSVKKQVDACKALQELLGRINDTAVLRAELARAEQISAEERAGRIHALALEDDDERLRSEVKRTERTGLAELERRVSERFDMLYGELSRRYLGDGAASFAAEAHALADELDRFAHGPIEVERKYLLDRLPEACRGAYVDEIDQGYLPGNALRERVRSVRGPTASFYQRTVKTGSGLARFELEERTTKEVFDVLWPLTEGCRVRKRRYRIEAGDLTWEIDEFTDRELVLAEVELPSPDVVPEIPPWLAPHVVREVTLEPEFLNLNLAK